MGAPFSDCPYRTGGAAAVRVSWFAAPPAVFTTCLNPLHRLHRVPRSTGTALEDVVPDGVELCDAMVGTLAAVYPPFEMRLAVRGRDGRAHRASGSFCPGRTAMSHSAE